MDTRLIILFALFAVIFGKPLESNETVAMKQAISEKCSGKEMMPAYTKCSRNFFLSFRTDKKTPCRGQYNQLANCYYDKTKLCLKPGLSDKALETTLEALKYWVETYKEVYCGTKEFPIEEYMMYRRFSDKCPEGTLEAVHVCHLKWTSMFQKNRGDPMLCQEYQNSAQCLEDAMAKCDVDSSEYKWIFKKEFNPFCDKKQLAML